MFIYLIQKSLFIVDLTQILLQRFLKKSLCFFQDSILQSVSEAVG